MKKNFIIGIAGGSASGKTTIVNKLKEYFNDEIELISHDCYYKTHDEKPIEERAKLTMTIHSPLIPTD